MKMTRPIRRLLGRTDRDIESPVAAAPEAIEEPRPAPAGADLVICNSMWTANSARFLQPDVPHRVIHCPVPMPRGNGEARSHIRAELGARGDQVVVLSASRLEPWKGHIDLVRALAHLKALPWVLWVAGGCRSACLSRFRGDGICNRLQPVASARLERMLHSHDPSGCLPWLLARDRVVKTCTHLV